MSHKDTIQRWFDKTVTSLSYRTIPNVTSVYLPDNPLGKPGDNTRYLTSITEKDDDELIIILDNQFTFTGLEKVTEKSVRERGQLLILGSFQKLELTYGDKPGDIPDQLEVFTEGEVTFGSDF